MEKKFYFLFLLLFIDNKIKSVDCSDIKIINGITQGVSEGTQGQLITSVFQGTTTDNFKCVRFLLKKEKKNRSGFVEPSYFQSNFINQNVLNEYIEKNIKQGTTALYFFVFNEQIEIYSLNYSFNGTQTLNCKNCLALVNRHNSFMESHHRLGGLLMGYNPLQSRKLNLGSFYKNAGLFADQSMVNSITMIQPRKNYCQKNCEGSSVFMQYNQGAPGMIEKLLIAGASLNNEIIKEAAKGTIVFRNESIAKTMLNYLQTSGSNIYKAITSKNSKLALKYSQQFEQISFNFLINFSNKLGFQKNKDFSNYRDEKGEIILISAIKQGMVEVVTSLLKGGSNPNISGSSSVSPIELAFLIGNKDLIMAFFNEKNPIQLTNQQFKMLYSYWNKAKSLTLVQRKDALKQYGIVSNSSIIYSDSKQYEVIWKAIMASQVVQQKLKGQVATKGK